MPEDWADKIAHRLLSRGLVQTGICLILGASDTGKTTLMAALMKQLTLSRPVGIIDADIGQSHIGPPTTVGWALIDTPPADFSQVGAEGISFVGDVTPVGHLLQLTASIVHCVRQASQVSELILIDTPGLVGSPAARALWWTVQRILAPKLVLGVQHNDELGDVLAGLRSLDMHIELIKSPPQIRWKSPQDRRRYRQNQFAKYFHNCGLYNIGLDDVSVQSGRRLSGETMVGRVAGLRDGKGVDIAIGIINNWQNDRDIVEIKAPKLDIREIRCLAIGDVTIEISDT